MAPPRKLPLVTAERLREVLNYDPSTGLFHWLVQLSPKGAKGKRAGAVSPTGYRFITIDGATFAAQRLAWLHVHGTWPTQWVDHKNRNRDDNRIDNLRDVSPTWNRHNMAEANCDNKTGFLGVVETSNGKFETRISYPGKKNHYLGRYATPEEAHAAFMAAKKRYQVGALP